MVESVDTPDLKSCGQQWPCRFDPGSGYQKKSQTVALQLFGIFCFARCVRILSAFSPHVLCVIWL